MEQKNKMIYRFLGDTGLRVSVLAFGNWLMDYNPDQEAAHEAIIKMAYENGVNFFDTAEGYGHGKGEEQFGRIFKKHAWPRQNLVISSKIYFGGKFFGPPEPNNFGASRKHCMEAIDRILERLQMEYLDVVFLHRPDDETPMEETVRAMNSIIDSGKAFYWGTSEWSGAQIGEAYRVCDELGMIRPVVEQCEYNMLVRDRFEGEYRHFFEKNKMGTTIWSPLASGMLTGKYNDGNIVKDGRFDNPDNPIAKMVWHKYWATEEKTAKTKKALNALADLAKEMGCKQAQLALAWAIVNSDTSTCLLGATKIAQFEENLGCLDVAKKWTPELDKKIREILGNDPTPELNWSTFPPSLYANRREETAKKFE